MNKSMVFFLGCSLVATISHPVFSAAQKQWHYQILPNEGGVGVEKTVGVKLIKVDETGFKFIHNDRNYSVSWNSSNTTVATVDSKGVVTGKAKGTAAIIATLRVNNKPMKLVSKITVGDPVARIEGPPGFMAVQYCTGKIAVKPVGVNATAMNDRAVRWSSQSGAVMLDPFSELNISNQTTSEKIDEFFFERSVTYKALELGQTVITAASEDIKKHVLIKVVAASPDKIILEPAVMEIDFQEERHPTVIVLNTKGCEMSNVPLRWTVSSNGAFSVDSQTGTVRGYQVGRARLTATAPNGVQGSIDVEILPVARVEVSPPTGYIRIGDTQDFTAKVYSSSGRQLVHRTVVWSKKYDSIDFSPEYGYTTTVTAKAGLGGDELTATSAGKSSTVVIDLYGGPVSQTVR